MEDSIDIKKKGFSIKIFEVFDICQLLIDCGLLLLKTVQDSERVRLAVQQDFFVIQPGLQRWQQDGLS